MEHSFQAAFVVTPQVSSGTVSPYVSHRGKLIDDKQKKKKKRMEEIQSLQMRIYNFFERLAQCQIQYIDKALDNLSLDSSVMKTNFIQISHNSSYEQIQSYYSYLHQSLGKLNSITKEIKKIYKCIDQQNQRKSFLSRESRVSFNQTDFIRLKLVKKSKTMEDKAFHHIKLLYKQQLTNEIKRRHKQQQIQSRQEKIEQILKANQLKKYAQKAKKQEQKLAKHQLAEQQMNKIRQQNHQRVEQKMMFKQPVLTQSFTKLFDYRENVARNRLRIEKDLRDHLDKLQQTLDFKHKLHYNSQQKHLRNIKTSKEKEKQNMTKRVQNRRIQNDKDRQEFFLTNWIEKSMYIDSLNDKSINKSIKKQQKITEKSSIYQIEDFKQKNQSAIPSKNNSKHTFSKDRLTKRAILKQMSQTLRSRNIQSRQRFERNYQKRRLQQQSRISQLNLTYHQSMIRIDLANERKMKKHNKHIHQNFKIRQKQDKLHQDLSQILLRGKENQIYKKICDIDSQDSHIFKITK